MVGLSMMLPIPMPGFEPMDGALSMLIVSGSRVLCIRGALENQG